MMVGRSGGRIAGRERIPESKATRSLQRIQQMDVELTHVARSGGALRLGLGQGLKALADRGGHREMGFSSIEAYALERCGRTLRWAQESRALAVTLEALPLMSRALTAGRIGWSMAALVAPHACAEDEPLWTEEAKGRTVREMRWLLFGPRAPFIEDSQEDGGLEQQGNTVPGKWRTLTVTVDREDAWVYECATEVVRRTSGQHATSNEVVTALIAEGGSTLQPFIPEEAKVALQREEDADRIQEAKQRAWEAQRALWREQAEACCERHFRGQTMASAFGVDDAETAAAVGGLQAGGVEAETEAETLSGTGAGGAEALTETGALSDGLQVVEAKAETAAPAGGTEAESAVQGVGKWRFDGSIEQVDAQIRTLADDLATRDLRIGRLAEAFWKADGWRRLRYASAEQYARERLGLSLSSIDEKRRLARRLEKMPAIESALQKRTLGYESARLVSKVATPETASLWVLHAEERTVRHLREETDIAEMIVRLSNRAAAPAPPTEELVRKMQAIESRIVSGAVFAGVTDANDATGAKGLTRTPQISAPPSEATGTPEPAMSEAPRGAAQISAPPSEATGTPEPAMSEAPPPPSEATGTPQPAAQISAPSTLDGIANVLSALLREFDSSQPRARATRSRGRVTLKLLVSDETYREYRQLERRFRRFGPRGHSFLGFLCLTFIDTWKHVLGRKVAYGDVYARDVYRCTNPVCGRRDVTPHHLLFRSAGGDDSGENLTSLCVVCHLWLLHGGCLKASPPASDIHWAIGRVPHTWVEGRRKRRR